MATTTLAGDTDSDLEFDEQYLKHSSPFGNNPKPPTTLNSDAKRQLNSTSSTKSTSTETTRDRVAELRCSQSSLESDMGDATDTDDSVDEDDDHDAQPKKKAKKFTSAQVKSLALADSLLQNWKKTPKGEMPSVRAFVPIACNCNDKATGQKAKMIVRPTLRGETIVVKATKGRPARLIFRPPTDTLRAKFRSFVCPAWTCKVDADGELVFLKKAEFVSTVRCPKIEIDIPTETRGEGKSNVVVSFKLNPVVRAFWSTDAGKRISSSK